ncbi:MAG: maleylacetoacetate isomerase [Castellaniella sp.]
MKLYSYFRSSAAYRVRIALNLKGLAHDIVPVDLRAPNGGEHHGAAYRAINPAGLVPALEDQGQVLDQSLAIIEYLEETHPDPALLPADALGRARVRALALTVACDIHPLNNLRVLRYLKHSLGADNAARDAWYAHWVMAGLKVLEARLASESQTGRFCHGDQPGLADACLIPQMLNARRVDCDLGDLPVLLRIEAACMALDAFRCAAPENQPDHTV